MLKLTHNTIGFSLLTRVERESKEELNLTRSFGVEEKKQQNNLFNVQSAKFISHQAFNVA